MIYELTKAELRLRSVKDFRDGDIVEVGKYQIFIKYTDREERVYSNPLCTYVEKDYKQLNCTPGVKGGWPYFIYDFIHRHRRA